MTATAIPRMSRGLAVVGRSLVTAPPRIRSLDDDTPWNERYVNSDPLGSETRIDSMSAFGYPRDQATLESDRDRLGFIGPIRVLDEFAVEHLARQCMTLVDRAPENPHIVSKRLRRADGYSGFIHSMVRSPAFLLAMSKLAGVPLMLHPHADAAVQVNYYFAKTSESESPQVARWHTDGMDYVFTLLLTDGSEYSGGDFHYFKGTKSEFESTEHAPDGDRIEIADFRNVGEGIFSRGSAIYHGVTPVTEGRRITLVVSLFCPYFHRRDSNRFWHSAPDDGFWNTLVNWSRFRAPWLTEQSFLASANNSIPDWNDL